jgi:hypothetical protein
MLLIPPVYRRATLDIMRPGLSCRINYNLHYVNNPLVDNNKINRENIYVYLC